MSNSDAGKGVSRSIRRHIVAGLFASTVMVCGVGAWAAVTNLSGAVVAEGHFVVDSYAKKFSIQPAALWANYWFVRETR